MELTSDAMPDYGYALSPDTGLQNLTRRRSGQKPAPAALWSPDSRWVVTHRLDQRNVEQLHLIEAAPLDGSQRPRLHSVRQPFVGDEHVPVVELCFIDVEARCLRWFSCDPLYVGFASQIELGWVWWGAESQGVYFVSEARGSKQLMLSYADAASGSVSVLINESADTYVDPSPLLPWLSQVRIVPGTHEIVWPSERSGWRHLYLYGHDGVGLRPLTAGEWVVQEVLHIDSKRNLYFSASGREIGRDPYLRHVYRVSLDGGEPVLLTPEDADHSVVFSPSSRFFAETASRVDIEPVTRVRSSHGELVWEAPHADFSELEESGWTPPERFVAKSADGSTDLYGVIYFPSDFDSSQSYPVIDSIYPGPQLIRTPKTFSLDSTGEPRYWPGMWEAQALAEVGFLVLNVDGKGTPLRSRAFHEASYGRLEDGGGLDDHLAVLRDLASERPYMDLERVGIIGHSGGAYAATRALMAFPDFYKVGVASSGLHDLRRYLAYWGEKYHGTLEETDYGPQANSGEIASRLSGKLLLVHGALDENCDPAGTYALIEALMAYNCDYDLLVFPNEGHNLLHNPYYVRRVWDYFVQHLLGADPPRRYRITGRP